MKYKESIYNIHLEDYFKDTDLEVKHGAVFNTSSGKFGIIPTNINYDMPEKSLVKNRFVVPNDYDETKHFIDFSDKEIHNEKPKKVILEIYTTFRCNMNCTYCFEQCSRDIDMSNEVLQDYINYIKTEIDRNELLQELTLNFFGGEPLLRIDIIETISNIIIPYCKEHNIKYGATIVTNGYLFTKEVSATLKKLKVKSAQITLDGFEDTYNKFRNPPQNAFNTVIQNISNSAIPVYIRLHSLPSNRKEILKLAAYLSELDSLKNVKKQIWVSRVLEYSKKITYSFTDTEWLDFKNEASKINHHIKKVLATNDKIRPSCYSCKFGGARNVCLSPDGLLYRCACLVGVKEYAVGTLKGGINADNKTNKHFVSLNLKKACINCILLPICNGGPCKYEELLGIDNCEYMKQRVKQNIRFHVELNQIKIKHSSLPLKNR